MEVTQNAETHEPTGDPEHSAFGQDYLWSCTCGKDSAFITTKQKAEYRAESHETYCDGHTTVDTKY